MKKRIYQKIKNKVISKENIVKLIDYVFDTYNGIESELKKFTLSFHTNELEVYEIENANLGPNDNILDIKRIESIKIDFTDYRNGKFISINLTQGDDRWSNNLTLDSKDEIWVNNQKIKLEALISSWQPQNKYYPKYEDFLLHFLAICIGFLIINLGDLFLGQNNEMDEVNPGRISLFLLKLLEALPFTRYLLILALSWVVGICPVFIMFWLKIDQYLSDLWPSIEFDFGPEHYKFSKRRRKSLGVIITLIVLPLLLDILVVIILNRIA